MQPSASPRDFLANPIGHYYRGRRCAVFAPSDTLMGLMSWGAPDTDDVREMLTLCEIGLRPDSVPHRFLVDVRRLESVGPATFGLMLDYTLRNREQLARNILRQAQLRPDGFVGAIIAGFSRVAKLSYPERVFGDVEEALRWLDIDPLEGVALIAELDAIRSSACESFEIVGRLRAELQKSGPIPLDDLARRTALSTRSLQRALKQAGTTYRVEIKTFQIQRAQELLRQEDRTLTWIATEIGFSSVQHFATAFRRAVGETPSAWRANVRPIRAGAIRQSST